MIVKEIEAKTILSKSQIYDYALNAYVGCRHNCVYCYAKFMKRFTGHREPWGAFVDVKINAAELLAARASEKASYLENQSLPIREGDTRSVHAVPGA